MRGHGGRRDSRQNKRFNLCLLFFTPSFLFAKPAILHANRQTAANYKRSNYLLHATLDIRRGGRGSARTLANWLTHEGDVCALTCWLTCRLFPAGLARRSGAV